MAQVKLTAKERRAAIMEARAAGSEFSDDFIAELALEQKQERVEREQNSDLAQLKARLDKLERALGPNCQNVLDSMAHAIGEVLPKYVDQRLVKRRVMRDGGVWQPDREYQPGEVVTCGGSGWFCKEATRERPGSDPSAWRLAIKKGRDAQ
jgi:hypothetical protein